MHVSNPFHTNPTLPFILILVFLILSAARGESPSLTFSQTACYLDGYECRISADSTPLSGFILLKSPDQLPALRPEIYSSGFTVKPLPGITLLGGSIYAAGLPSRVRSPVFTLYTPFYTPIKPQTESLLSNSSTRSNDRLGAEIAFRNWRLAACAVPERTAGEDSWVLLSKTGGGAKADKPAFSVSLFLGTNTRSAVESESWFSAEPYLPDSFFFIPAVEAVIDTEPVTASGVVMMDSGPFRVPARAVRSDLSIHWGVLALSGGAYSADRSFINLKGQSDPVLRRLFIAPALIFPCTKERRMIFRIGGLLYTDTLRGEKFCDPDTTAVSSGTGLEAISTAFRFQLRMMHTHDLCNFTGGLAINRFFCKKLQWEVLGKAVIPETKLVRFQTKETTISSGLTLTANRFIDAGIGGSCHSFRDEPRPVYSFFLAGAAAFSSRHQKWNLSCKATLFSDSTPSSGTLLLQTTLR